MIQVTAIASTGDATVLHTETGHTGTVPFAQILCSKNADGSADPNFLQLACPTCGATSTLPVTGGTAEGHALVQQLFAVKYKALSVAALVGITTYAGGCTEVLNRATALGEGDRCKVVGTTEPAPLVLANSLLG